jgi:hypothetical protein
MRPFFGFLLLTNYEHMLIMSFEGAIFYGKTEKLQESFVST